MIAATLGIRDLAQITEAERDEIKRVHLLLAMFNAMQPGVFALSGWDLAGMLTVDAGRGRRPDRRGRHALDQPRRARPARRRRARPRGPACRAARSLYGTLPEQLADPHSFASRLRAIIDVRDAYGIATATQIDVPEVSNKAELITGPPARRRHGCRSPR